jgi:hypothetical protein
MILTVRLITYPTSIYLFKVRDNTRFTFSTGFVNHDNLLTIVTMPCSKFVPFEPNCPHVVLSLSTSGYHHSAHFFEVLVFLESHILMRLFTISLYLTYSLPISSRY